MAAAFVPLSEIPVLFDGYPHILTDLGPQTTCDDLIFALLRFRQALSPLSVSPTPNDCDFYVIRHGERRRKINRNVRIQTFYRHYTQRYSTANFSFEVVASRRPLGVPRARAGDSSPDREPTVAFFDAEASRREKEEQELRRHLLKTIARQSQELERLRVELERVETAISDTQWKILPSRHLPECLAHYDRLHRCNKRLLIEHARIEQLTAQIAAARKQPGLRRTVSESSILDANLDSLHVPPPSAFLDDPNYVNYIIPPRSDLYAGMKHLSHYGSQPLDTLNKISSYPQHDEDGVDSDTGLGSLSDEGGASICPAETLV